MTTDVKFDDTKYKPDQFDRITTAPDHNSTTVIKYISPRVISSNISHSIQGSVRSIDWSNTGSSYPPAAAVPVSLGLAALAQTSTFTTIPSIHSIDGERIIDEQRELSRLTETLGNTILQCCNVQAHNHAMQLQIEWLESHRDDNGSIIAKKYLTEMDSAKKLIHDNSQAKPPLDAKYNETKRTISAFDEQYQQLLSKRNASSKELFDYERQIAQNIAESQFLQRRIHNLDDESKFYLLKNQALHSKKVRLRHDLDEELFSHQSLKMELEILENERISNEDARLSAYDDVKNSIDISQIAGMQSSKHFSEKLNHEVQRIRTDYEKKIEVYREELHRQFELELHRYHILKTRPSPLVTRDHQSKLEQYQHEKKEITQQIAAVHGRIKEMHSQMDNMQKQTILEKSDQQSIFNMKRHLSVLNQTILDRERQLDDALKKRNILKEHTEQYKVRLNRHSRERIQDHYYKRTSYQEENQSSVSTSLSVDRALARLSLQDLSAQSYEQQPVTQRVPPRIVRSVSPPIRAKYSSLIRTEDLWDEGTLTGYTDFNLDQDCQRLYRLLNDSNQDEIGIIQIFCNRSVGQRLQIRERYKQLFNQNLGDAFDMIVNDNLSKLLRILELSPIERDCFELRRILKAATIDEDVLVEIFFSRTNAHIQKLKHTYQKLFKATLEEDIIGDRDNSSKKIFVAILQSNRPEDNDVNDNDVLRDARTLYETGTKWKTDGSTFTRLLCTRSNTQLKQIFATYQQFSKVDIEQAIQIYMEGNLYYTLVAIVRIIRNRPRFFAHALKKSIKGAATNEDNLNRIVVSRCEFDMVQIKSEYDKVAKRTLYDHIQTDIKGNYKRALLELLRQRIEPNTFESPLRYGDDKADSFKSLNSSQPSVHWKDLSTNATSPSTPKRSFVRNSTSEKSRIETSQTDDDYQLTHDRSNQVNNNTLFTIKTKFRSQYVNRRSFTPMPTTEEDPR